MDKMINISNESSNNGLDFIRYFSLLLGLDTTLCQTNEYLFISSIDLDEYKNKVSAYKCVVIYDLFHLDDDLAESLPRQVDNFPHPNKVYLTVNANSLRSSSFRTIFWDVLMLRSKCVYFDPAVNLNRVWYYASPDSYIPNTISIAPRTHKFIYQCRNSNEYRQRLLTVAMDYQEQGYISDVYNGKILESQDPDQPHWDIEQKNQGLYLPIANSYYDNSYLSVYVESSYISEDCIHVTEKTWEPLIKGHFILPFSNPGYITHLRVLGFGFPEFIDYSYDDEPDTEKRVQMVEAEFRRLMKLDLENLYNENIGVIINNRLLIQNMPYPDGILQILNDNSTI